MVRLVGVYHADGGLRGELAYLRGALLGGVHCSLCEVTHRGLRRRRTWDVMCAGLGVPFDLLHLNERSAALLAATGDRTPIVVAELRTGTYVDVLDGVALDAVAGDVPAFANALSAALMRQGLTAAV